MHGTDEEEGVLAGTVQVQENRDETRSRRRCGETLVCGHADDHEVSQFPRHKT